jgi:tetratricopeptide (TPR) repeat protein
MLGRYGEAIDDYTAALALKATPQTRAQRGWAYLMNDATRLALGDFEAVLKEEPGNADAHNGRGLARARLGQQRSALEDAEEALRRGGRNPRTVYNAARVYAQVAGHLQGKGGTPGWQGQEMVARCQERATGLVREALELVPTWQRAPFWRECVQGDAMMDPIRPALTFGRLAARYAAAGR